MSYLGMEFFKKLCEDNNLISDDVILQSEQK